MPPQNTEIVLRQEMLRIARQMYQKGLIAANDGNLSVRLPDGLILTTPSGLSKGLMEVDDLVVTDMAGQKVRGERNPSSELRMHLKVYEVRPDVQACVHAHPPVTTAFSVAGISLSDAILPETVFVLGQIRFIEYATPTTEDVPKAIADAVKDYDALVLTRHGSLTVGACLNDAYFKLESLEHSARIISEAMQLAHGLVSPLPESEIERLWKIHERIVGHSKARKETGGAGAPSPVEEALVTEIVAAMVKRLGSLETKGHHLVRRLLTRRTRGFLRGL